MSDPLHRPASPPPVRRHPAHPTPISHSRRPILVFLTVCTRNRQRVLATPAMAEILVAAWQAAANWQVGRYVILPDHVHLFCSPATIPPGALGAWVKFWKSRVTQASKQPAESLWQRDYWDTQVRDRAGYESKWAYVRENPVRAGLVSTPDEWAWQGEVNQLSSPK